MERGQSKKSIRQRLAVLIVLAMSVSMLSSVIVTPRKAAEAEANYLMDFAVSALENTLMEALGWAADKSENEGVQDIYKMMSVATGGSGTDAIIQYCQDIQNTLGVIRQDIGRMDSHLTDLIVSFQNRVTNLVINDNYKKMQSATNDCDTIITTYNDYIEAAKKYASAQKSGNAAEIEQTRQEAERARGTFERFLIRPEKDITNPYQTGKIGTDNYDNMLRAVNDSAGTQGLSWLAGKPGSQLQQRSATFTGLLYESYSLQNNIFDHQHREAIETGVNACASQFIKILMAYRIQLDYISAENDELVEQGKLSQEEADSRMKAYEGKYTDYINAVTNAFNDVGSMYQDELSKMMHSYDKQTAQTMLYDANQNPGPKETRWYYVDKSQHPIQDRTVSITKDPGISRELQSFTSDPAGFFRGNVNGVSYLISKKSAGLVPEDFVYPESGNLNKGDYTYKLRSRYFYNFMTTKDGAYRMIQGPDDLAGLYDNVPAWTKNTNGFRNYLSENGQLSAPLDPSGGSPFDENARYIVLSEPYKKTSPNSGHDTDGAGELVYSLIKPHYTFYQNMWMLNPDFNYQSDLGSKKETYNSYHTDVSPGVLLIMKSTQDVKPSYDVSVRKLDGTNGNSLTTQQVEVANDSLVPAGDQLKIKVTPDEGWTLESLKIIDSTTGDELDTLSGPGVFNYIKDGDGSFTYSYHMPYRNIRIDAAFTLEEGGDLEGDGSKEHPYLIKNVKDYLTAVDLIGRYTLDAQAHYTVVNDIDFSGLADTKKTEIEEKFKGVWDGGGHVFKNLGPSKYSKDSPWMQGVEKEGVVKNLTFENNRFIQLVTTNYGTIDNCANTGVSQAGFQGLTYENTGKILNCYNTAEIIGNESKRVAAIVHNNNGGGLVVNCWNRGEFKSLQQSGESGGLVVFNEGHVYNCYNIGKPDDSGLQQFGALIYNEVSDEQGSTIANSFYPKSLKQWSELPLQPYSVGTMLTDEEMHSDDGLLKKLNEGVGKAKTMPETKGLELKYWGRSDEVNDGYPTFIDTGDAHSITVESEYGAADLAFLDGTKVEGMAPARMPLALTVTPDKGREIEKITLLKTSGETLGDIPVTDRSQDVLTAQFAMPAEDCILRVDYYQFIKDKDTHLIGDYPALLSAARAVNASDYFASANFRLTADIKGNNQEWPVPIGTGREYSGTFDGAGFSIARLWFDQDQMDGGIFGTIGEKGTVKNLGVFGFTVKSGQNAGGIAAMNNGTIDNCYSGTAQLGEGSYIDADGEHSLSDLNSSVSAGMYGGGIVGYSKGIILNSRSGADVYARQLAGGIAGETSGHVEEGHGIFNSYAMGNISSESTAGGITAQSKVCIENVYFAGNFKKTPGGQDAIFQGSIVGEHYTEILTNCYFLNSTAPENSQAQNLWGMKPVTEEVMRSRAFADTLNSGVTKAGYDYWTQKDSQRRGYPYLTHNTYVEQSYTDPETGITISGMIHAGAVPNIKKLEKEEKNYKILDKYVNGQKLKAVFDIGLEIQGRDKGRNPFKDSVILSFPADSGNQASKYWIVHYNGEELHVHKDISAKDQRLEVRVEALNAFGIIRKDDADEASWNNHLKKVKTGDDNNLSLLLVMASISILTIAAGLYYKKRRK